MIKYYTGVGSREIPEEYANLISRIAKYLHEKGYILRSGGADGSDTIFEKEAGDLKEIFLPWKGFNGNPSTLTYLPIAEEFAKVIHPKFSTLSSAAKKLHTRNVHQVLGRDLKTPSKFVVAYTNGGQEIGGTRTAIVLAKSLDIPVFNIGFYNLEFIDTNEVFNEFIKFVKHNGYQDISA